MMTEENKPLAILDQIFLSIVRAAVLLRYARATRMYLKLSDQKGLPDPALPKTVSDKYFWRKVFDRNPDFARIADKIDVRDWLAENGFELLAPKIVWTGEDAADIPDEFWTPGYVLKANHGCAWNIFLLDPMPDRETVVRQSNALLKRTFGNQWAELFYSDIKPRLLIEEYLDDARIEMKFFMFGNVVQCVFVRYDSRDRAVGDKWRLDENGDLFVADEVLATVPTRAHEPLPETAGPAMALAKEFGRHFDHVRVDILSDGKKMWFGELTFTNLGGHVNGDLQFSVDEMNALWDIRKTWFFTTPQKGWRKWYAAALLRRLNARSASVQSADSVPAPQTSPPG